MDEHPGFRMAGEADLKELDTVIVALAHRQFKELGAERIAGMIRPDGVVVDVKALFRKEEFADVSYWRL